MNLNTRRTPIVSMLVTVLFVSVGAAVYLNRINLMDWWLLRSYQAPASIAALANDTTMNGYGRKLFYVNRPAIEDKDSFNASCREDEQTIVLGCFIQNRGIYVLNVTDTRLDGVQEVTAAHEMLHAAYQRLSKAEKNHIDALLLQTYDKLQDARITTNINAYKNAKADIVNELHSILGTEVGNLPPELEQYYRQYFSDRSKIVAYSEKYENELTSRKNKIVSDDQALSSLEPKIKDYNNQLDSLQAALQAQKDQLNNLRSSGDIVAYNAGVGPYNKQVTSYNALITKTNQLIAEYRQALSERNGLAQDLQTLTKALDSRITTRNQL